MICGLPTVKDPKIPLLIFDKSNADTAGKPPQVNTGYGDAYIDGYRQAVEAHVSCARRRAGRLRRRLRFFASKVFRRALAARGRSTTSSLAVRHGEVHGLLGSERLGQIDADQDPQRVSRAGRIADDRDRRAPGGAAGRASLRCARIASASCISISV